MNLPQLQAGCPLPLLEKAGGKALAWRAESEYRVTVHFNCTPCRCLGGDNFRPITDNTCALMEVILGCRCSLDEIYVDQTLKEHGFKGVRVARAKLSLNTFEVER